MSGKWWFGESQVRGYQQYLVVSVGVNSVGYLLKLVGEWCFGVDYVKWYKQCLMVSFWVNSVGYLLNWLVNGVWR